MSWSNQRTFKLPRQKGGVHLYQAVNAATVSPDNKLLVTVSTDATAQLWSIVP